MRLAFALIAALLVLAAPAKAAGPQVGIADDRVLLGGGAGADQAVADWAALGIEQVRIYALWSRIAPEARPNGFDGANPASPGYDWAALDHAVDRVTQAGMKPILTVTGPGPGWVSRDPGLADPRWDPDPKAFADYAKAVATRYGDRVDRYVIWNEPNLSGWLRPQASCTRAGCTAVAPHLYRELVRAAYPAIHDADPKAEVLIGAMASRGGELRGVASAERPLVFLRALGCVSVTFKKVRSGRCKGFKPVTADGFAYHPHGLLTEPERAFPHPDDVSLASLPRLESALDRLQRLGALDPTTARFNLFLDELGYQTSPPDRLAGVSLNTQDQWLQRAAYQAWRDPRVKLFTQYLWRDEPLTAGWQSGLRFSDGRAKPSLRHFATPFVLDTARGRLWGQVRRRDTRTVTVQRRLRGSTRWTKIATRRTDALGYWSWTTRLTSGASYRYLAANATSATITRR
jgi:hypothetical protein